MFMLRDDDCDVVTSLDGNINKKRSRHQINFARLDAAGSYRRKIITRIFLFVFSRLLPFFLIFHLLSLSEKIAGTATVALTMVCSARRADVKVTVVQKLLWGTVLAHWLQLLRTFVPDLHVFYVGIQSIAQNDVNSCQNLRFCKSGPTVFPFLTLGTSSPFSLTVIGIICQYFLFHFSALYQHQFSNIHMSIFVKRAVHDNVSESMELCSSQSFFQSGNIEW